MRGSKVASPTVEADSGFAEAKFSGLCDVVGATYEGDAEFLHGLGTGDDTEKTAHTKIATIPTATIALTGAGTELPAVGCAVAADAGAARGLAIAAGVGVAMGIGAGVAVGVGVILGVGIAIRSRPVFDEGDSVDAAAAA